MDQIELHKLLESLAQRKEEIKAQLSENAKKNPAAPGDYEVVPKDYGEDEYDNAREETDLERDFAMVRQLKSELQDIERTEEKIKNGTYGACDNCSGDVGEKRLKAQPVANLCINCAKKTR